jgi:steroid delta-isomerase-like uncharacterized protein
MEGEDLVRKLTEAWNSHDAAQVAACYARDATVLDPAYPEPLAGPEAVGQDAAGVFAAFPDITFRATKVIADGGTVVVEAMAGGTHTGPLRLPTGLIPATGRRLEFSEASFLDLDAAGSIREERRYYDVAGVLTQLGLTQ